MDYYNPQVGADDYDTAEPPSKPFVPFMSDHDRGYERGIAAGKAIGRISIREEAYNEGFGDGYEQGKADAMAACKRAHDATTSHAATAADATRVLNESLAAAQDKVLVATGHSSVAGINSFVGAVRTDMAARRAWFNRYAATEGSAVADVLGGAS